MNGTCTVAAAGFVMNQIINEERTRAVLVHFYTQLALIPFTLDMATTAQRLQMADLENACIAASAVAGRCDVIASRNVGNFTASPIAALVPFDVRPSRAILLDGKSTERA